MSIDGPPPVPPGPLVEREPTSQGGRVIRRIAQSRASALLLHQLVTAATAFSINIMAARVMAPAERGWLALALQIAYLATTMSLLGVESPFVARREVTFARAARELTVLLRTGTWLTGAAALVATAALVDGRVALALTTALVGVYAYANARARAVRVAYIASGVLRLFLVTTLVSQLGLLGFGAVLLVQDVGDPNAWLGGYAVLTLAAVAILHGQARKVPTRDVDHEVLAEVRRDGIRLLPASLGNTAMLRSDRLLLPVLASTSELGTYVVVATALEMASWPVKQWVDASLRRWRREHESASRFPRGLLLRVLAFTALLTLTIGAVTYTVVVHLLTDAYEASLTLILPLGVSTVIYSATRVQQGLLLARGFPARVSAVELTGMITSVTAYVVLIPGWGALGAAVGSIAGYGACLLVGAVVLARSGRASGTASTES